MVSDMLGTSLKGGGLEGVFNSGKQAPFEKCEPKPPPPPFVRAFETRNDLESRLQRLYAM